MLPLVSLPHKMSPQSVNKSVRVATTLGAIVFFISLTSIAARAGLASLFAAYAGNANVMAAADAAVNLSPGDPDVHLIRGELFEKGGSLSAAIKEYETAATARSDDYVLWLSLARAAELNGERERAIAAARRAIPLAPFYAQPHWQLGNMLLRAGRKEEAFKELRLAGASNPTMMPGIIELAWQFLGGSPDAVTRALNPERPEAYAALGQYFRQRGEVPDAIAMYAAAGSRAREERRSYLAELVSAKRFKEAADLWAVDHSANAIGEMIDPGFEQETDLTEPGFGWRAGENSTGFHLSLDSTRPRAGRLCLQIKFDGNAANGAPIITQLVRVEAHTQYQIRFAARSESIISGGLPFFEIVDANTGASLAHSDDLPQSTVGWRDYSLDFNSGESPAIQLILKRKNCSSQPCPIFGRLWLDGFSLLKP